MFHSPLKILQRRSKLLFLVGVLVAGAAVAFSFVFPLEYRADAQVFIISKTREGVDPFTVVRSAERVGENVAAVMQTNDFYEKVVSQQGFSIDTSMFDQLDERKQRKAWKKAMRGSVVANTGILNISAYSEDQEQALALAGAAAEALVRQGWEYVGGDVTMKLVNSPVASKWPVRPNLLANAILGFLVGVFGMAVTVLRRG